MSNFRETVLLETSFTDFVHSVSDSDRFYALCSFHVSSSCSREGRPTTSTHANLKSVSVTLNHLLLCKSWEYLAIEEKTYSEEQHPVNSRYELLTTRQLFCGDISTLFQSHCHIDTLFRSH